MIDTMTFHDQDTPSAADLKRYAAIEAALAERRQHGIINGRDWTGALVEHTSYSAPKTPPMTPFGRIFGAAYEAEAQRFAAGEWWSIFGDELMAVEDAAAAEYRKNRVTIDAANDARIAAADARLKAERVAIRVGAMCTKRKTEAVKVAQPCKFLYNCQGTPARPTTMHVTTECWSHEYTDPVTGAKIAKHVCDRMHPGEEGWLKQWDTDRNFRAATRNWDERGRGRW
jgi:hypothetical protein